MKRDTKAKVEEDVFFVGNIKILGVEYIVSRILSRNKIPEDKFLISVNDDGSVLYALEGTAGEYKLLEEMKIIGYYRKTLKDEVVDDERRVKPSLRRDLINFLEESGFIKKLK